ncbi:non-specific serine/threonine protein kinase [Ranunculus cassubicifolius]
MWLSAKGNPEKNDEGNGLVAVGLDRDKGSQHALKWAVDHILSRGQTVILVHVKVKSSQSLPGTPSSRGTVTTFDNVEALRRSHIDQQTKELFLPFRFFCTRKDVVCRNVVLEDTDVAKALIEYVSNSAIETLVIGASSKHGFLKRFKSTDISSNVSKHAPDFCNVYVINKGKIASMRTASCAAPTITPRLTQMRSQPSSCKSEPPHPHLTHSDSSKSTATDISASETPRSDDMDLIKSPFTRRGCRLPSRNDIPIAESDLSFVSTDTSFYDQFDSSDSDIMGSFKSVRPGRKMPDASYKNEYTSFSQNMEDVEAEMRRLKLELKQTMDMYSRACKEALTAKQKTDELARWKMEEQKRMEEARMSEEAALSLAEREKAKARAALEAAEAQQRIALLEAQKRVNAEMKALKEKQEKMRVFDALAHSDARYRKYTIDDIEQATEFFNHSSKVGEGGYGPVYKVTWTTQQLPSRFYAQMLHKEGHSSSRRLKS